MSSLRDAWFELGAGAAGGLSPLLIRAMVATCGVTCHSQDVLECARRDEASIGVLWHQDLVFFGDLLRGTGFTILASRSRDGDIGARIAHRLGLQTVRGSMTGHEVDDRKDSMETPKSTRTDVKRRRTR